jgi:hypothetical protein
MQGVRLAGEIGSANGRSSPNPDISRSERVKPAGRDGVQPVWPLKAAVCGAEEKQMAPATRELIRKIERERAWSRLEVALSRVEWAGSTSRRMTVELDKWRSQDSPARG